MIFIMLVKKVVYQLMAAGPILLLGLIAVNSRAKINNWQFVEYGPETSSRLFAYSEPIMAVRENFLYVDEYDSQDIHDTIGLWLTGYRKGELQDIFPVTTVAEPFPGAYQQIVSARHQLLIRAKDQVSAYVEAGEYSKAADLCADIIEIANIAKFGEFSILAESSGEQTEAMLQLVYLSPFLEQEQRDAITERINQLDDESRSLAHIVSKMTAVYSVDLSRQGRSYSVIEAARTNQTLASTSDMDQFRVDEWRKISGADESLITLFAISRMAYLSEQKFESARELAINALKETEPDELTQS